MRRPLALLLALAATLAIAPATGASGGSRGGWTGAGIVQAPGGRYLTDALGRRLELHGVNLVAKCGGGAVPIDVPGTPCVGPAQGPRLAYVLSPAARDPARRFTAGDARTMVRLGFNTVRLGIIWEGLEPGPAGVQPNDPRYCAPHRGGHFRSLGRADPYDAATVSAYLRRTDRIIDLLARVDIRVVLDMHQDVWGSAFQYPLGLTPWSGEGAPPWATCTNGLAFDAPVGWGTGYTVPAVQAAIHHFWANDVRGDLQGQFARVWAAVAEHYAGNPDVLGYEVMNEPNDYYPKSFYPELQCDYGGPVLEPRSCRASHVAALRAGLIGTIRTADPGHVVLFEPSGDTDFGAPETLGMSEPLRFRDLALAFHVYGYPPDQLRETFNERSHTRTGQPGGPAWIMDEFGASNNSAASAQTVAMADASNLSWAYWSALQLDDPSAGDADEGLLDQITGKPFPSQAQALAVPYPWATAGTPGRQSFNPVTGTFRYAYGLTPKIPAVTEIELPPYVYPHGYSVRVQGARVVSRKGASLLELSAGKHARRVFVTVWRR